MKYVLIVIMFCVVMCSCEDQGNTGNVTRYARSIYGCGNGRDEAQMWYRDDYGDAMTQAGNRLAQVGDLGQYYCDDYGTPGFPVGWCENVALSGGSITNGHGRVCIRGIPQTPGSCDGHPSNMEHQASGMWGIPTLSMAAWFSYAANPPRSPIFMVPSDNCPQVTRKPPTPLTSAGPISGQSSMALSAPTSGGATTSMMSLGPVDIDPNTIVLPTSGVEWDMWVARQYDDHAIKEDTVSASNSDHWEDNYRYQVPCVYEILVLCSEPIDPDEIVGLTGSGYVKTDLLPEGISVELKPVTSNADNTVWLLMTDKFLPVQPQVYIDLMNDPNEHVIFDRWTPVSAEEQHLYDPNMYTDPNDCANYTRNTLAHDFMDRHDTTRVLPMEYLPCNDVDTIRFQFEHNTASIVTFLSKWLQTDYNVGGEDGHVDLEDWAAWFNY